MLDDEKIIEVKPYSKSNLQPVLEFLTTLEPNDTNWIEYLKNNITLNSTYSSKISNFEKSNSNISIYLKNISIYFIWRYFLKGTFDEDILSKVKLMAISIAVLKYLFFCKWLENKTLTLTDCINITKKFSEEIEYSEDNIYALAEASYNLDFFNTEYLLGLF